MRFLAVILVLAWAGAAVAAPDPRLRLTPAQGAWLAAHAELTLAPASRFAPYEFFDDKGGYRGVAADYMALLARRLGVRVRVVRLDDEAQRLRAVADGDIDIVAAIAPGSSLAGAALLTRPHITMPGVIVASTDYPDLHALRGRRVAVVKDAALHIDEAALPADIDLLPVRDVTTALELISSGRIDALLTDMATASYYIHREGMTEIRIVGSTGSELSLAMAVRRDWPQLQAILQKALDSITRDEREQIARQWIHLKQPSLLSSRSFWIGMLIVALAVVLVMGGILAWNRALKRQVAQRTRSLDQELRRRLEAEQALQKTHADLVQSHRQLKQTQMQLIHAAKMESVGRLAAGVAHEVKNPLAVIHLGMDYLEDGLRNDPVGEEVLADMEAAVRRADSVINSLLNFSREGELSRKPVRINDVIEASLHLVRHELVQHDIEVVRHLGPGLPPLQWDLNRMQQVFVNLFMNAIQAMGNNGTLTVSTYQTLMEEGHDGCVVSGHHFEAGQAVVVAEVSDTGPGVAADELEKMFDPFYTTKPVGEGTGLGLSVIRNIIDLHEGAIEVRNLAPRGFSVRLCMES
ncbi:MAG TPA: transporter substrate-binding domain-containing protein [Gammaproteobacteria bacterium]|nr:transporter substrate-binding domain-containing protein [Gammaproteobacteria bacterium]